MGKYDDVTSEFMRQLKVFADAINLALFNGAPVVDSKYLTVLNTTQKLLDETPDNQSTSALERRRDLLMKYDNEQASKDSMILGIENQTNVDISMPFRIELYDALTYLDQMNQIKNSNKDELTVPEKLAGIPEDAPLVPVFTLVIFWSCNEWKGPRSIYDFFANHSVNPRILDLITNRPMRMIVPSELTEEQINSLKSDLKLVMQCLHTGRDKKRLHELISNNKEFKNINFLTAKVINTVLNLTLKFDNENEDNTRSIDMCQAMIELLQDERNAGRMERQAEIDLLNEKCISAEARCASVEEENKIMKEELILLRSVEEENQTMKEENQTMKEENQTMKEENQTMKEELAILRMELAAFKRQHN